MKIRSKEELVKFLDEDISWRKKELTLLRSMIEVKETKKTSNNRYHARALLVNIYAHWEGFIKNASLSYLTYLCKIGIGVETMKHSFYCLYLYELIKKDNKDGFQELKLFFDKVIGTQSPGNFRLPNLESAIDVESNLSFKVFAKIANGLDLDTTFFDSKSVLIDVRLLAPRNKIVHGENHEVDLSGVLDLHRIIIELLDAYKTLIENAVLNKTYLK